MYQVARECKYCSYHIKDHYIYQYLININTVLCLKLMTLYYLQGYRDNPKINAVYVVKGKLEGKCFIGLLIQYMKINIWFVFWQKPAQLVSSQQSYIKFIKSTSSLCFVDYLEIYVNFSFEANYKIKISCTFLLLKFYKMCL